MAADDFQDVVDLDAALVGIGRHVAEHHGGEVEGDGRFVELLIGNDAVQGAFELAAAAGDAVGDKFQDVIGDDHGMIAAVHGDVAAQDNLAAQFEVGQLDVNDQAAHEPRAHALVDGIEL